MGTEEGAEGLGAAAAVLTTLGSVAVMRIYSAVKSELCTCVMLGRKTVKGFQA